MLRCFACSGFSLEKHSIQVFAVSTKADEVTFWCFAWLGHLALLPTPNLPKFDFSHAVSLFGVPAPVNRFPLSFFRVCVATIAFLISVSVAKRWVSRGQAAPLSQSQDRQAVKYCFVLLRAALQGCPLRNATIGTCLSIFKCCYTQWSYCFEECCSGLLGFEDSAAGECTHETAYSWFLWLTWLPTGWLWVPVGLRDCWVGVQYFWVVSSFLFRSSVRPLFTEGLLS